MNIISFAGFDGHDKPLPGLPDPESDEPAADFSAILSNIFTTLQPPEQKPAPTDQAPAQNGSETFAGVLPTTGTLLDQAVFSEPLATAKTDGAVPVSGQFEFAAEPAGPAFWANSQPIRQRWTFFKQETKPETLPPAFVKFTDSSLPKPVEIPDFLKNTDLRTKFGELSNIPEKPAPTQGPTVDFTAVAPIVPDDGTEAPPPVFLQPENDIPGPDLSLPADTTTEPALFTEPPAVPGTSKIPVGMPPVEFVPVNQVPKGFQPVTRNPVVSENSQIPPTAAAATDSPVDHMQVELAAAPKTAPPTVQDRVLEYYGKLELRNPVSETPDVKPQPPVTTPPIINPDNLGEDFPADGRIPESDPFKIQLQPKYSGGRITGFDLSPNEIRSLLGTFENIFKKSPVKTADAAPTTVSTAGDETEIGAIRPEIPTKQIEIPVPTVDAVVKNFEPVRNPVLKPLEFAGPINQPPKVRPILSGTKIDDGKFPVRTDDTPRPPVENVLLKTVLRGRETPEFEPPPELSEIEPIPGIDRVVELGTKGAKIVPNLPPDQIDPRGIVEQIAPQILQMVRTVDREKQNQTLRMRLHPAELGTVEIRLERGSNGALNAYFQTETDAARKVLTTSLDQLRENLHKCGLEIGQIEISTGTSSSNADRNAGNQTRHPDTVFSYDYRGNSENPDDSEPNAPNRLLSLLA
ncbi:MAG: flagellar hook-length control protein FliK [Acidobacteria bacterium]|nr:flagellar hook-length control protein FliK [Acidobacteriota bacterium]